MRRPQPDDQPTEAARPPFTLRRMVPADLPEAMRIERLAFAHPWSEELFGRELTHEWSTILLAEEPGPRGPQLRGFVIFWLVYDELHILNVATDPTQLRRGIAKALIAEALARGKQAGVRLATLEVRRSNLPAIRLYESFGFRTVAVRPRYYSDENEDGLVMNLDFP